MAFSGVAMSDCYKRLCFFSVQLLENIDSSCKLQQKQKIDQIDKLTKKHFELVYLLVVAA